MPREDQNVASIDSWAIKVGGSDLASDVMDKLISAEVDNSLEVPDMAVLRFHDNELQLVDGSTFDLGKELEITSIKDGRTESPALFKGEITAIEPSFEHQSTSVLTIRGYDKRHRLNRDTKTRSFVDVKDSDIVSQLGGSAGLSVNAEATSEVRKSVFQQNQTDFEFLIGLARRNGYEIAIDGTTLHFRKVVTGTPATTLGWGVNLLSFQPRLSLAGQVNEVTVRGWDNKDAKAIVGVANSSKTAPQIGFGKWGGQAAQSALSAAKHYEVRQVVHSQSEATKMAQSILDEINSDFIEADGVADANSAIRAGKIIKIEKIGTKFSGQYHVTSATHVLENGQYRVYFRISGVRPKLMSDLIAPTAVQTAQAYVGAAPAIVTDNNDPDNAGRVKLKFPWYDDTVESWWARIAMPGAGQDRGLFILPEVNDEVLVVFEHGDMNRPIVLGGLYNSQAKPPLTSSDAVAGGKVVQRVLKTSAGHVLTFTEKSGAESIEMKDGKGKVSVTMDATNEEMKSKSSGKYSVESKGDYAVESKGTVTIKSAGSTVTIDGSGGVTIKTSATMSIQGSTIEVKSSGPLTLKGNPVQIN